MLNANYQRAVQLLLRTIPAVFTTDAFALKGGTAINLFYSPVTRLSVDLDLVFLPLGLSRDQTLGDIKSELAGIAERAAVIGLNVRNSRRINGIETQLFISDGQTEVKMEVNHILRGSVLPPLREDLHPIAQKIFATNVTARLLASAEVYAGKAVAALDRQHPRDLFDVWVHNSGVGYTSEDLDVFAVYLAGHNRPPSELLAGRDKPIRDLYESALVGMTLGEIPSVRELDDTRSQLRHIVLTRLSSQARKFLTSFFALTPDWEALPFRDLEQLPSLQWKLHNLSKFKVHRPEDFAHQHNELNALLF